MAWYHRATNAEHVDAMLALGELHFSAGEYQQALFWFKQAADEASREAPHQIARMHLEGRGVPRSPGRARLWMSEAAAWGHPDARRWLRAHAGYAPVPAGGDEDWNRYYVELSASVIADAASALGTGLVRAESAEARVSLPGSGGYGRKTLGKAASGTAAGTLS